MRTVLIVGAVAAVLAGCQTVQMVRYGRRDIKGKGWQDIYIVSLPEFNKVGFTLSSSCITSPPQTSEALHG